MSNVIRLNLTSVKLGDTQIKLIVLGELIVNQCYKC